MNRREFLKTTTLCLAGLNVRFACTTKKYNIRTLTRGPKHHFFGYYGICPWNKSETYLLGLEADFQNREPSTSDRVTIGLIDNKNGKFERITETNSWNFQQGAMLHWNPLNPDSEIIYNDRENNQIVSKVMDINTGNTRVLDRAVNAISHNGRYALSLSYGRLGRLRNDVAYSGVSDPGIYEPYPENDGVYLTDLKNGTSKLIVSIAKVNEILMNRGLDLKGSHMWFNHVVFNKSDSRFLFLARTWRPKHLPHLRDLATGMYTANIDGSDLRETIPFEYGVSHFDWRNDHEIVATFQDLNDNKRFKHFIFKDGSKTYNLVSQEKLNFDGHCSFAPDQTLLATDRKIIKDNYYRQYLYIYDMLQNNLQKIVDFDMQAKRNIKGVLRCDFHPRWNHTGDTICIDGIDQDNGTRQMFAISLNN